MELLTLFKALEKHDVASRVASARSFRNFDSSLASVNKSASLWAAESVFSRCFFLSINLGTGLTLFLLQLSID